MAIRRNHKKLLVISHKYEPVDNYIVSGQGNRIASRIPLCKLVNLAPTTWNTDSHRVLQCRANDAPAMFFPFEGLVQLFGQIIRNIPRRKKSLTDCCSLLLGLVESTLEACRGPRTTWPLSKSKKMKRWISNMAKQGLLRRTVIAVIMHFLREE